MYNVTSALLNVEVKYLYPTCKGHQVLKHNKTNWGWSHMDTTAMHVKGAVLPNPLPLMTDFGLRRTVFSPDAVRLYNVNM